MTDTTTPDTALPPASLPRRLGCLFYDSMLTFGVLFFATAVFQLGHKLFSQVGEAPVLDNGTVVNSIDPLASGMPYQLFLLLTLISFFSWFWLNGGQTLGMQAWRVKLESVDNNPVTFQQVLLRLLGALLSAGCVGLGYLWVLVDKDKRSWHDRLSKTHLVVLPKRKK